MSCKLTSEQIKKIRKEIQGGKVKYSVAKELGISDKLVYYYTKDLPSSKPGNSSIRGKTLDLLKQLLNQGYIDSSIHLEIVVKVFTLFVNIFQLFKEPK